MKQRLGIGFSGLGWIGSAQMRKLTARLDVKLVALHGPNAQTAKALLDELQLPRDLYQSDFDAMLRGPEVDVIWIASPNAVHGSQLVRALEAGKHVFREKPVSIAFDEYVAYETYAASSRICGRSLITCFTSTRWRSGCARWSRRTSLVYCPRCRSITAPH